MTPNFYNTEVAFARLSNADLRRSLWMFRLLSSPTLVDLGEWLVHKGLRWGLPVKPLIRATLFRQFAGGETAEECLPLVEKLWRYRIHAILDYSVEGQSTHHDFGNTVREIKKTIDLAACHQAIPFSVFKMSGLALSEVLETGASHPEYPLLRSRVEDICTYAAQRGVPVFIDAEESWIQNTIDELALEMMRRFNRHKAIVFNTVQLYRRDRLDYLRRLTETGLSEGFFIGVKLVRGAYLEKEARRARLMGYPNPLQESKHLTDEHFNQALHWCVHHLDHLSLCAGTHNEESSTLLVRLMQENKLAPDDPRVWFSQLLGMSDHISFNLAAAGYNVAKYIPYAPIPHLIPYLVRRARENTSVQGQTSRELRLIRTELRRRAQGRHQPAPTPSPADSP